jgi:hypothetical protein
MMPRALVPLILMVFLVGSALPVRAQEKEPPAPLDAEAREIVAMIELLEMMELLDTMDLLVVLDEDEKEEGE